jgi:hypothetical protein
MVAEGELLPPVGGILGVVHVQHDHLRRRRVAGDEVLDEDPGHAIGIATRGRILQNGTSRCAGQIHGLDKRLAIQPELEYGIPAQRIGIVAVFVGTGNLIDPLRHEVAHC